MPAYDTMQTQRAHRDGFVELIQRWAAEK
jgi:hypothetical protein